MVSRFIAGLIWMIVCVCVAAQNPTPDVTEHVQARNKAADQETRRETGSNIVQQSASYIGEFVSSTGSNDSVATVPVSQRLLPRIHRRTKRAVDDPADFAVASLNLLGIGVSLTTPSVGVIFSVLATLLSWIQPNGDPATIARDIVWNERVEIQRRKMIGLWDVMNDTKRHSRTNLAMANTKMQQLDQHFIIAQCEFMRRDNIRLSLPYFKTFADAHIAVIQALIIVNPDDSHWPSSLEVNVRRYVAYGKIVIQVLIAKEMRFDIATELKLNMSNWIRHLPGEKLTQLLNSGAIRNSDWVAFKVVNMKKINLCFGCRYYNVTYDDNEWLSCWGWCINRRCPGTDNPMERGPQFKYKWRCSGEIFRIESIDATSDGIIRSCSRVGLWYSEKRGKHWWLSNVDAMGTTTTRSCPGRSASSMRDGSCSAEAWNITAPFKSCGDIITDRDTVQLINRGENKPLDAEYFSVFRADVDHDVYYNDVQC